MPIGAWRSGGLALVVAAGVSMAARGPALAQTPAFVAPPRTIADITAILDQEKPDPAKLARQQALADARPPTGNDRDALIKFYHERAKHRAELGRRDAIADIDVVIKLGQGREDREILNAREFRVTELLNTTEYTAALAELNTMAIGANRISAFGYLFLVYRQTVQVLLATGDLAQAETYVRRLQTHMGEMRTRPAYPEFHTRWEAEIERAKGHLAEAKGQYRAAEAAYRRSEQLIRVILSKRPPEDRGTLENRADLEVSLQGRVKAREGRLAEAEADVRRGLLSRLRARGKYSVTTTTHIDMLAFVLREQGRYAEAEKLNRASDDIRRTLGLTGDSQSVASGLSALSNDLRLQGRHEEALQVDAQIDKAIKGWDPRRRAAFEFNVERVSSLYTSGKGEAGIAAARALLANNIAYYGEKHFSAALARGFLAIGLRHAGEEAEAVAEFQKSVPILVSALGGGDIDDSAISALRNARVRDVVEGYIGVLARSPMTANVIGETLQLADAVRGRSVQQALAASSARMVAGDAALAELARKHQDLEKQINALLGVLNNVLAAPPEERSEAKVQSLRSDIEKLRNAHAAARKEIGQRFPSYAQLIDPKAPGLDDIRAALKPGEAFLSFYIGQRESFVWAVPKDGEPRFAAIAASAQDVELKVKKIREILEANDLPLDKLTFDLATAHELYQLLLQPVEKAWRPARELVVVTNGSLGLLPLVLLPTAPTEAPSQEPLPFAGYRDVKWLARTHAVSAMPSAAAFTTLRRLPPGPAAREKLIGFGDPYFTAEQAKDAESDTKSATQVQVAERGARTRRRARVLTREIDSAGLDRLPRLADTAEELRSVAAALSVDPAKALHLGRQANERVVKQTDLSRYRIVAFATHGLVPGDLDGLTQPALALTAPAVAGIDGDGLLTMEEILPLKLNADWVILSACNTATGAEAGAEAISGLGRAFFYAGTRALLVTNWAVHSASARDLVTDLFRRQATETGISRAQALRQAMLALMDGPGYVESGQTVYTYAHPMFWAPYSIVGDGG